MSSPLHKLATAVVPGDCVLLGKSGQEQTATVLAVVDSVQLIRKKVLMVTFRGADGRDIHRQVQPNHTFRMVPPKGGTPA